MSARRGIAPVVARQAVRRAARGFSLVELMVAVVISLVLVLAITGVMTRSEAARRGSTSLNDTAMNGAYLSYTLDRMLRSAGSGFSQARTAAWGCRLLAQRAGTQLLPRTAAFPPPFATVPQAVRLAPLVVHAGAGTGGSDVLAVATGASGLGEAPLPVLPGSVAPDQLRLPATVGLRPGDLVLVLQDANACMVQQVKAGFVGGAAQLLEFGGPYAAATIAGTDLTSLGGGSVVAQVAPLGNAAGNQPELRLLGVGANATLLALDLLRLDGSTTDAPLPIADGVADLRARYGIDSNDDGTVDTWASPGATGWTAADLLDGSDAARLKLGRILAVRVGLVLRNAVPERDPVSPDRVELFSDLGPALTVTRSLSPDEQRLRWRTLEFTVPLRNAMLKPA